MGVRARKEGIEGEGRGKRNDIQGERNEGRGHGKEGPRLGETKDEGEWEKHARQREERREQ